MKVKIFLRLHFTNGTGETITWKAERVGVVTMTKKVNALRTMTTKRRQFLDENIG